MDLCDLVEAEVAYAERVTVRTAQRWRSDGDGPPYCNEVGIRYSVAWYWEWRHKGRQTMTAQGATWGRCRADLTSPQPKSKTKSTTKSTSPSSTPRRPRLVHGT
jgi:hypothetical protein